MKLRFHRCVKEKPIKTQSLPLDNDDIYFYIETTVGEICFHEIEKLK